MNLTAHLAKLKELESAATEGPFLVCRVRDGLRIESDSKEYVNDGWVPVSLIEGPDNEANAQFIVEARNALPTLLRIIEIQNRALLNMARCPVCLTLDTCNHYNINDSWPRKTLAEVDALVKNVP